MLRTVLTLVLTGFTQIISLSKRLVLDKVGNVEINFFHFLLFGLLITITIRIVNYMKQIQEVEEEKKETKQIWKRGRKK